MQTQRIIYPLRSQAEVRTALRKRTVQTAIYKNQAEAGGRNTTELLAYVGFMTEEECQAFLNSAKEAPFIPNINMMWTQQVIDYLMLTDVRCIQHCVTDIISGAKEMVDKSFANDDVTYSTKVMQRHVDKAFWHLLPDGWGAKYYRPSQVLKIAINCVGVSDVCKHIAERLFIKAADLEDCLSPVTKMPPALPELPKTNKENGKTQIVLRDFPEGSRVTIDIPKSEEPIIPKVAKDLKSHRVSKRQHNPVGATAPMFASDSGDKPKTPEKSNKAINSLILKEAKQFGGTKTVSEISDMTGIGQMAIHSRIYRLRKKYPKKSTYVHVSAVTKQGLVEAVKTRMKCFGGNYTAADLSKEFDAPKDTIYGIARRIRKQMAVSNI